MGHLSWSWGCTWSTHLGSAPRAAPHVSLPRPFPPPPPLPGVRCAAPDDDSPGVIDVFSSGCLSCDHDLVSFNATSGMRAYGRLAVHSTLGNLGVATQYNRPHLTVVDLSKKEVAAAHVIPKAHASYDLAYSGRNEHVFASVRVCCTCGSAGADLESCGRGPVGMVLVTTGPSASEEEQMVRHAPPPSESAAAERESPAGFAPRAPEIS